MDHTPLIEVRDLKKEFRILNKPPGVIGAIRSLFSRDYKTIEAIKGISFSIGQGELVGYVGPNGAGKSTTIKILSGILYPGSGHVTVGGLQPHKQRKEFTRKLGVMFGQRTQLWWDLPVSESFDLLRTIYRVSNEDYKKNIDYFNQILQLDDFWSQPVRRLSLGQRVRADLAASILHNPSVLLLDEPTIGLDVLARSRFRDLIKQINQEKKTTILVTSHDLGDIEMIARRLILIDHGLVMYDGALKEFMKQYGGKNKLNVYYKEAPRRGELPKGTEVVTENNTMLELTIDTSLISYQELLELLPRWGTIVDIQIQGASLENILSGLYER